MSRLRRVLAVCACALAFSCERKSEPPTGGIPPLPPSEQAKPAPPSLPEGHPTLPEGHPQLPQGHPPVDDNAIEGAMPGGEFDPHQVVSGALALAPSVKEHVQPGDVIFLTARADDGTEKGPIVAVKKLEAGAWPQAFELDGRDAMQGGTKFAGKIVLTARVDKDGDPISKNAGDVLGVLRLQVPAKSATLTLDTLTK